MCHQILGHLAHFHRNRQRNVIYCPLMGRACQILFTCHAYFQIRPSTLRQAPISLLLPKMGVHCTMSKILNSSIISHSIKGLCLRIFAFMWKIIEIYNQWTRAQMPLAPQPLSDIKKKIGIIRILQFVKKLYVVTIFVPFYVQTHCKVLARHLSFLKLS